MKTYEERKKETCEWCAKGRAQHRPLQGGTWHASPTGGEWLECVALSREDYEAELRAEIEKMERWETGFRSIVTILVGPRVPFEIADIVSRVESLRAAFDAVATVIQGAYLNGQLPPISDAELAEKIITEYSSKRASAYEQGKRADTAEAAMRAYQGSKGPTGYPRWLEDRVSACRKEFMGQRCDAEDMCNEHRAQAGLALADASPQPENAERKENAE